MSAPKRTGLLRPRPVDAVSDKVFQGHLERYDAFPSDWVDARTVEVWLPASYAQTPDRRYPVLYMHDGQNLFDPGLSFSGIDWGVDETLTQQAEAGQIAEVIAVGIWNTPKRILEYMPQQPLVQKRNRRAREVFAARYGGEPASDWYLNFIVTELKPFMDAAYRTLPEPAQTTMIGSSMGGLVSLYAFLRHPEVFGRAGCLSTSWPIAGPAVLNYLKRHVPPPDNRRIYFDYGAEARLVGYALRQKQADAAFQAAGYAAQRHRLTRAFPGAPHSELAWRKRLHVAFGFLLAR